MQDSIEGEAARSRTATFQRQEGMRIKRWISGRGTARILVAWLCLGPTLVSGARDAAAGSAADAEISPAFIVPLFPQKERELKKGLPPGMIAATFWSARGTMALTKLADGKVKIEF